MIFGMGWETVIAGAVLTAGLVWLSVVDLHTLRLPDALTFPLIVLGIGWQLHAGDVTAGLVGAGVGYAAFVLIEMGYRKLRGRHGLGRGDAKLLAAGGAWCGWEGLPLIVLAGSFAAMIAIMLHRDKIERAGGRIPFGPFLAFGIAMVFWGQALA